MAAIGHSSAPFAAGRSRGAIALRRPPLGPEAIAKIEEKRESYFSILVPILRSGIESCST